MSAMNGNALRFPENFLWGTATSTTQIEGHIQNEWTDFTAQDGSDCRIIRVAQCGFLRRPAPAADEAFGRNLPHYMFAESIA